MSYTPPAANAANFTMASGYTPPAANAANFIMADVAPPVTTITAKSVVIDIADNWGDVNYMGVRAIEFWLSGSLIPVTSGFTAYATTTYTGTDYVARNAFDTSQSKVGSYINSIWLSGSTGHNNQRLIIVFDNPITFDSVIISNTVGSNYGVKNIVITSSTDSITNTVYNAAITNSTVLVDTYIPIATTTSVDDPITIFSPTVNLETIGYRSVVFDIADAYNTTNFMGVRSIEFFNNGSLIPLISNFSAFATTSYDYQRLPEFAFNTSLSKTGSYLYNAWLSSASCVNQRLTVVFNTPFEFDEIVINNSHTTGGSTQYGVKNVKVTASPRRIADTTYNAAILSPTVLAQVVVDRHPDLDIASPQTLWEAEPPASSNAGDVRPPIATVTGSGFSTLLASGDVRPPITTITGTAETSATAGDVRPPQPVITGAGSATLLATGDFKSPIPAMVGAGEATIPPATYVTAKSVIFDVLSDWGLTDFMGVRRIEFYLAGNLIPMTSGYTAYALSSSNGNYAAANAFNTSLSKVGSAALTSWWSGSNDYASQRLIIVFGTPVSFDKIVINNNHSSGSYNTAGFRSTTITISSDAITATTYGLAISNSQVIFNGEIAKHPATDTVDDVTAWEWEPPGGTVNFAPLKPSISSYGSSSIFGVGAYSPGICGIVARVYGEIAGSFGDYLPSTPKVSGQGTVYFNTGDYRPRKKQVSSFGYTLGLVTDGKYGPKVPVVTASASTPVSGRGNYAPQKPQVFGKEYVEPYNEGRYVVKKVEIIGQGSTPIIGFGRVVPKIAVVTGQRSTSEISFIPRQIVVSASGTIGVAGDADFRPRKVDYQGSGYLLVFGDSSFHAPLPLIRGTVKSSRPGILQYTQDEAISATVPANSSSPILSFER